MALAISGAEVAAHIEESMRAITYSGVVSQNTASTC